MKNILLFIAIIVISIATLCSCSSSKGGNITVVSSDGKEYESYEEACHAQDYESAHKFLAAMKKARSSDYEEAREYIFGQEALYLIAMNDDEAFVKTLANQYTQGANEESLKKLMDYLFEKSQNDNKEFIGKLFKKIEAEDLLLELAIKDGDKKFIRDYASKHLFLSNTTLLNYLAGTKDKKDAEMILGQLAEEGSDIPSRPALGTIKSDHDGKLDFSYNSYIRSVKYYNDACLTILNVAITTKNQYLAQRAVSKAKPNIVYKNLGDWGGSGC